MNEKKIIKKATNTKEIFLLNHKKSEKGITLVALVVTIIILIILAAVSISLVLGEHGLLKMVSDAKIETEKGQEKEIIAIAYNSALAKKVNTAASITVTSEDLNPELSNQGAFASGSSPITVTFTDSKRQYTINNSGTIEYAGIQREEENYQWVLVDDVDNDGVLSIGDEVAPLIDTIQNEHFYVLSVGESVGLVTKLAVDYVTNSQSSTASYVTYDMAYCNKEGETETLLMPSGAFKGYEVVDHDSEDGSPIMGEVYYGENETGEVHCTGTYTKAYRNRLVAAGLQLNAFSNSRL